MDRTVRWGGYLFSGAGIGGGPGLPPRGPRDPDRALPFILQILDGLAACHARHIIHRDLKPENVLLTRQGDVRLTDFGIAKVFGSGLDLTVAGQPIGTPVYMSPEQVRGEPLTATTDVYSVGVILHEMVSGSPPYSGRTREELYGNILRGKVPRIGADHPAVRPELAQLIARSISGRIGERPATATVFFDALQRVRLDPPDLRALAMDRQLSAAASHPAPEPLPVPTLLMPFAIYIQLLVNVGRVYPGRMAAMIVMALLALLASIPLFAHSFLSLSSAFILLVALYVAGASWLGLRALLRFLAETPASWLDR